MYWVGKQDEGRIGRGKVTAPACETRWIVPVRPYQAPKGSMEKAENMILMGAGVAAFIFGMIVIGMAGVM